MKAWTQANRKKAIEYVNRRRAAKAASSGEITSDDIALLLNRQKGRCPDCRSVLGKDAELDHIMPLSKGGAHHPSNAQILCRTCNRRKGAKDPIAWSQEIGRLI